MSEKFKIQVTRGATFWWWKCLDCNVSSYTSSAAMAKYQGLAHVCAKDAATAKGGVVRPPLPELGDRFRSVAGNCYEVTGIGGGLSAKTIHLSFVNDGATNVPPPEPKEKAVEHEYDRMKSEMLLIMSIEPYASLMFSEFTGEWFVSSRLYVKEKVTDGGMIGAVEHRPSAHQAVSAYLTRLQDSAEVVSNTGGARRRWRWNGAAFTEVHPMGAG